MPRVRAAFATPLRLLLRARNLASLALALALQELFRATDPRLRQATKIAEAELRITGLAASLALDRARLDAIPPRQRPHATTELARDILRFQDQSRLTSAETARLFGFAPSTIRRWRKRREARGEIVLGPAFPPIPPSRRVDDLSRELVRDCDHAGFEGKGHISRALAAAGTRVSVSAVGRIRQEPPAQRPAPPRRDGLRLLTTGERLAQMLSPRDQDRAPTRVRAFRQASGSPCATVEFTRRAELKPPRRARLLVELRDEFQLALLELVQPLLRTSSERLALRLERLHEAETRLREQRRLVRARLAALTPRRRPRFTPAERVEILLYKHSLRLSDEATAHTFVLARQTLSRWNAAVDRAPCRLLEATPPLHQEAIRRAGEILPAASEATRDRIILTLDRLCESVPLRARRSVGPEEREGVPRAACTRKPRPIRTRHPNHYWTVDLSELRSLHGVYRPQLAIVLDLYSRFPLAWGLWPSRPNSADLAALLERALKEWGPPEHVLVSALLSDQGGQFTREAFETVLRERGIDHRFGAVGEHGSIAVIERLWKTLKEALVVNDLPRLQFPEFERRLGAAIDWYARLRPHSSLKGATPLERYLRLRPACLDAQPAPRGKRGEPGTPHHTQIRYALPDERRLPYLVRTAA